MSDLYIALTLIGVLFIVATTLAWAYQRLHPNGFSLSLVAAVRGAAHAARWSFRNRWISFAWWFGLLAFAAAVATTGGVSARWGALGVFCVLFASYPLGAALGGLIDAMLRSRRSKSRAVVVR